MTDGRSWLVWVWWVGLCAVSLMNVFLWLSETDHIRRRPQTGRAPFPVRRDQALLAAVFVAGCAFRSLFPSAEPRRICFFDTWLAGAALGRAMATAAEVSFVIQWALLLGEWARRYPYGRGVARLLVPLIALAEVCSWYATLTTNFLGSVFEESLWTVGAMLLVLALPRLWLQQRGARRQFVGTALVLGIIYVVFMCTVDVPLYLARWRADQRSGRQYLTVREGWRDATTRRILTRRWSDWSKEVPWMSLYFSGGVWLSVALVRAPRLED